jgi:hypothetical protein
MWGRNRVAVCLAILFGHFVACADTALAQYFPGKEIKERQEFNQRTEHWPTTLLSGNSFDQVGKSIANEPGFPTSGTDVEKARYCMNRLPDLVSKYSLSAGNTATGLAVFAGRLADPLDPESNAAIKALNLGNCAEFSMFFQDVLRGAGVTQSQVFYGDNDPSEGHSLRFTGTDTAIYVPEVLPDGTVVRRVFDPFRAVYHGGATDSSVDQQVPLWSDRPMTDKDSLPRDVGKASWIATVGKNYVKGQDEKLLNPATTVQIRKVGIEELAGLYRRGTSEIQLTVDGMRLSAVWRKGPGPRTAGKTMFASALPKAGSASEFTSNTGYSYADDCPRLAPYRSCPMTIKFVIMPSATTMTIVEKNPKYWSGECKWAVDKPWATKTNSWTQVETSAASR